MRTLLLFVLASFALAAALAAGAGAQKAPTVVAAPTPLNDSARALVAASREAFIEAGLSPAFFDGHFSVVRVFDSTGDRRVVWRMSVGGYETNVNDSIGYYTEGSRRVDTHSVSATLKGASDITRTLTRRRAELLMRRCIGRFLNPQVEYRAHGPEDRPALLLTAHSLVPRQREESERGGREERERREREERERRERARSGVGQKVDEIEAEDEEGEGPIVVLGAVNLVTGECSRGYGQSGPIPPKPARRPGRQR